MGVLGGIAAAVGLALAGCYAPSLRDCTVSCTSAGDCATGQMCGDDGMCASPAVAGRCGAPVDAGSHDALRDAAIDAAPPDAGPTVRLTVQVMGMGSVAVEGAGTCSSLDPDKGHCMYNVAAGVPLTAQAIPIDPGDAFAKWSSMTCAGQGERCLFTPVAPTTIAAQFVHSAMHLGL
jgi:hypothetical protein